MKLRLLKVAPLLCAFGCSLAQSQNLETLVPQALDFVKRQFKQSVVEIRDSTKFARSTLPDGSWKTTGAREWTSGFFPGALWYMHEYTGDPFFKSAAERWTSGIIDQQFNTGTHDLGFMVFNSFGNGNRLYPSDSYKKVILQSAQTLATRFNATIGSIKSWDNRKWDFPVIIDNMMNLELLFWAAENGGPKKLREIAIRHAETTMKNHFRLDGSTYHVVGYDTTNGSVKVRNTHQGYADESVWARGQAWAIYGYTMTYRFTKDARFLETAQRAADYFINHLPSDGIPYWDFMAPNVPNEPRDVSAAAIASAALFELSKYGEVAPQQTIYRKAATKILTSLCSAPYLAEGTNSHAVLNHAVGSKPAKSEVDVSIIYADYYFIEAMLRYLQQRVRIDVASLDRARILGAAERWIKEPPLTITAYSAARSAGGLHEYFSEGDYWWPDPKNPDGPFIRRDGETNPDNFNKHREAMRRLCDIVSAMTAAYKITSEEKFAAHAIRHLRAWCVDDATKMYPHLKYAQAIKGRFTGRGTGIIDTIHLIEVARAIEFLAGSKSFQDGEEAAVKRWFAEYLKWLTTSQYGIDERESKNNHGTWWVAQVATFAHLVNDTANLSYCRSRFKEILLPKHMKGDGSFPEELARTKPYSYSIFNLEGMAIICWVLSTTGDNLWEYTLPDGRNMRKAVQFLYPYIVDKSKWPYAKDVMHFEAFPGRQPFLLFAGIALGEPRYIETWKNLEADSKNEEVQRSIPIRQPVLWVQ